MSQVTCLFVSYAPQCHRHLRQLDLEKCCHLMTGYKIIQRGNFEVFALWNINFQHCGSERHRSKPRCSSRWVLRLLRCRSGLCLHFPPKSHSCRPPGTWSCSPPVRGTAAVRRSMFACTTEFHRSYRLCASSLFWLILRDACECQADSGGLSHEVDLKESSRQIQSKYKQFMVYECSFWFWELCIYLTLLHSK